MKWDMKVIDLINQQPWVDRVGDILHELVHKFYESLGKGGAKAADILHGTWLGHPVHSVMTDIPIGAWTAAVTLDVVSNASNKEYFSRAADTAIGVGIAGAVGAAATGLTDWQHTTGAARRVGVVHALLNTTGLVLFISSMIARKAGKRGAGQALALLGFSSSSAAAFLGGHLTYNEKVGVDHAPALGHFPDQFTPVMDEAELPQDKLVKVELNGMPVVLLRRGTRVYAIAETCSHLGGPLSQGELTASNEVICPWHGSRFSMEDGSLKGGPSIYTQPCFETRVLNGKVELRAAQHEQA